MTKRRESLAILEANINKFKKSRKIYTPKYEKSSLETTNAIIMMVINSNIFINISFYEKK